MFIFVFPNDTKEERKCTDSNDYLKKYYDILSKYKHSEYQLLQRISIFDKNYTFYQLGMFLWDIEYMEKFKKQYENTWEVTQPFQDLIEQLKKVYHSAYDAEQNNEKKLYGSINTIKEEYRAISITEEQKNVLHNT